jgi:hypothetical protein
MSTLTSFIHAKGYISSAGIHTQFGGLFSVIFADTRYSISEIDLFVPDASPVNTSNQRVGGIGGWVSGAFTISHSIATGHVYSRYYTGGISGLNSTGTIEHSLYTGKNAAPNGERGALAGNPQTIVTNSLYDSRNSSMGCGSTTNATNCNSVATGTTRPFNFGFAKELEYVEQSYLESTSVAMRKISSQDQTAYKLWGRCTVQNATINLSVTDGSTTVNDSTTCKAYNWSKTVNLSSLADGAVTVTANQAGSFSKTLHVTKQTAFCDGNPSNGDFAGGDGTSGTPYLICTTSQFDKLRNYLAANTYFRMMNSIDLSNGEFAGPIGSDATADCSSRFCGILQGNGFVVKNIFIVNPTADHVGIFATTDDTNARIERLGFENLNVIGRLNVGGIIGTAYSITLDHVYAEGHVMANATANARAGGLVGEALGKLIMYDSFADVTVMVRSSEGADVGGIFGKAGNWSAIPVHVQRNRSDGHVMVESISSSAKTFNIGGFAGYLQGGTTWSSNLSTGHIVSQTDDDFVNIGGFYGRANLTSENNLASGSVLANINASFNAVGGFAGMLSAANRTLSKSYFSGHIIQSGSTTETGIGTFIGEIRHISNGKIQQSLAFGSHLTAATTVGSFAGFIENQAGNQVLDSYFWDHALNNGPCIAEDLNTGDADTCNDAGTGLNYSTFSNFTSATAVYSTWDFTNTWKFPSGGGLPILKWMIEL